MRLIFEVAVEVAHRQGKFASRDELAEQIKDELEGAIPGDLYGDEDGEYEVEDSSVEYLEDRR